MSIARLVPPDLLALYEVQAWRKAFCGLAWKAGGGGCPVGVFGIRRAAFVDDRNAPVESVPVDPGLIASEENDAA